MLRLSHSQITNTAMDPVVPGQVIHEGQALVRQIIGGVAHVRPAAAATGEIFAGISAVGVRPSAVGVREDVITVATGALVHPLTRTPTSTASATTNTAIVAYNVATGARLIPDAAAEAGVNFSVAVNGVTGKTEVTFLVGDAGTWRIQYSYTMTADDFFQMDGGPGYYGPFAVDDLGLAAVIYGGQEIVTDRFIPGEDWTTATAVKTTANGMFVPSGSAATCSTIDTIGVNIVRNPGPGYPWLALRLL